MRDANSTPWQQVTERRLDRLRTIKSRMVRLDTRVETVQRLSPFKLSTASHALPALPLSALCHSYGTAPAMLSCLAHLQCRSGSCWRSC